VDFCIGALEKALEKGTLFILTRIKAPVKEKKKIKRASGQAPRPAEKTNKRRILTQKISYSPRFRVQLFVGTALQT